MTPGANKKSYPPGDGSLPAFIGNLDWHAEHNPSVTWVAFPSPVNPTTIRSLSYLDFACASHRIAHVLRSGRTGDDGEVLAMLLNCDTIHYNAMIAGSIRAGFVPYPMSPRNTPEAVVNMIEKSNCHRIICSHSGLLDSVQQLLRPKGRELVVHQLPPLEDVFPTIRGHADVSVDPYPLATRKHEPDDTVIHLHSSGSTGFPKTITLTQKIMTMWLNNSFMMQNRRRDVRYALMGLPTFHAMGVILQFIMPLANAQTWIAYEPKYPAPPVVPTPQNTIEVAKLAQCDGLMTVPTFLEAFAESEETIAYLKTLRIVLFGGAPLSSTSGNKLESAGVRMGSCYGSTEFGPFVCIFDDNHPTDPDATLTNWEWFCFPPDSNVRLVPQGDGSFEPQFLTCATHQPAVENIPDVKGYATSDLVIPHPTKPGFWKVIGRLDDVIILGSGEKIVPLAQENFLSSRLIIQGAVMFGRGKSEPGVILEPTPEFAFDPVDETKLAEYRNIVWPYVEEANKLAPAFARIFKEMIIVTYPDKPMGRAGKGSVLRKKVLSDYSKEIEQLYETVQESKEDNGILPPSEWSFEQTEAWLLLHAASISSGVPPVSSTDLFEQGFDSLSATFLRNRILGALKSSLLPAANAACKSIPQDFVFANPTINKLAHAMTHLVTDASTTSATKSLEVVQDTRANEIETMIAKYADDIPEVASKPTVSKDLVVLLTGSTGSLGSHLLATFLQDSRVQKVYTLDRGSQSEDVKTRQKASFEDKGLSVELLESEKLVALKARYEEPTFGLDEDVLDELRTSLTHIVHSAWKVDFNLGLGSFEPNIRLTRRLLDLSATCSQSIRFLFCSSISSASGWDGSTGEKVPEEVLRDSKTTGSNGYSMGKYVAERMLSVARKRGHAVTSLRIGQITGSLSTGAWSTTDWVPIIVKSSVYLGCLPDLAGDISWLSMDGVCHTIQNLVTAQPDNDSDVPLELVNVVHPRPVSWHEAMMHISTAVCSQTGTPLSLVPFEEWIAKVEDAARSAVRGQLEDVPAVKLLHFLKALEVQSSTDGPARDAGGIPKFVCSAALRLSPALKHTPPLGEAEIGLWIEYWRKKAFLRGSVTQNFLHARS